MDFSISDLPNSDLAEKVFKADEARHLNDRRKRYRCSNDMVSRDIAI
jgi:hypothetical protein